MNTAKCIYQQWDVFRIGYIDLDFSGCANIIWDYVSEEASWFSVSQLSQVSHTEAGSSYGKENWMDLLIDTFCWLKPPLSYINCSMMNSLGKWIWEMWCLSGFKKQSAKSYTPSSEKSFNVLHFNNTSDG